MVAEQLCRAGLRHLMVSGPTARAGATARRFGCNEAPFDRLDEALADADIVVSAVGAGRVLLGPPRVEAALKRRRRKPVLLVDAAIPPDIDPAVNELDGAFVYDLDDLERAAMAGRAGREAAARDAWRIVDAEVAAFRERRAERAAVPAIVALREHFERVRAAVVAEANDRDPEAVTRLLVNRLLHAPSEALRRAALEEGGADGEALETMLRRLFRLDRGADEERDE
jgi:glutamyl-tRNA reductase